MAISRLALTPRLSLKDRELIWQDEFGGRTLDRSKWRYRVGERRKGFWVEDAVTLDGKGHLVIRTYESGGKYYSGAIMTRGKFSHRYGYWEARCKLPVAEGHWAAFWIQSWARNSTEIDVFEFPTWWRNKVHFALHRNLGEGKVQSHCHEAELSGLTRDFDLARGFHRFGVEWTPHGYGFYVDRRLVWRCSEAISRKRQFIILSEEIDQWGGQGDITKARLPDYFAVDYVRVYA